jgi:hypothetical protein
MYQLLAVKRSLVAQETICQINWILNERGVDLKETAHFIMVRNAKRIKTRF